MSQREAFIKVNGMSCGHCVKTVQGALEDLRGVDVVEVEIGHARVRFDPDRVERGSLASAIDDTGFEVEFVREE